MHALVLLCRQAASGNLLSSTAMSELLMRCTTGCLKQAAERIARVRKSATVCTLQLLDCQVRGASHDTV
jgi:hypothetical protein